jgi:hypothetical protein
MKSTIESTQLPAKKMAHSRGVWLPHIDGCHKNRPIAANDAVAIIVHIGTDSEVPGKTETAA